MLNDKTPEYWFMISKHDSESAESLLSIKGHADIIIYHFHQAVEKLLERLYSLLCKKNEKYMGADEQIIVLNSFSNQLRYPESDNLSFEDAKEAHKAESLTVLISVRYKSGIGFHKSID